jgi:hypothetical protein
MEKIIENKTKNFEEFLKFDDKLKLICYQFFGQDYFQYHYVPLVTQLLLAYNVRLA